jgi:hypothetical protein
MDLGAWRGVHGVSNIALVNVGLMDIVLVEAVLVDVVLVGGRTYERVMEMEDEPLGNFSG